MAHGFDNETLIVGEEEKATRRAAGLSGAEDLVHVCVGVQRFLDAFEVNPVHQTDPLEQ